jgi:hypothetical protein
MSRGFLTAVGIGLAVVAILIAVVLYQQRGARLVLDGQITQVRTLGMDESSSVAIVDLQLHNPSDYPIVIGESAISVVDSQGEAREGRLLSAGHTNDLFQYFPALGSKTGENLLYKDRLPPGASRPATLAARFEISKGELDARQSIRVTVNEIDGTPSQFTLQAGQAR